uniref:Enoyl reductase (ER) domain-containing protein n=1 Tax=Craspedostauros australis TaxID=1486917 RepID=A0A7R9ZPS2_9STRA
MRVIQVHEFVSASMDNLTTAMTLSDTAAIPELDPKKNKGQILVRVLACSISPGDVLMVQGNLIFMHPDSFPFTPGMDICGQVVDSNGSTRLTNGDVIVASNGTSPQGGLAEYMIVDDAEAIVKPASVSIEKAAASSSAITARNAVLDNVKAGDRVLILGGSGGVGSAAIAMAKTHAKASFVATTSTQKAFCESLGADKVINYKEQNWWEMEWEQPFDKIIDTVGGGNFTDKAHRVLKPGRAGGVFIAVAGDDPKPDVTSVWKAVKFFFNLPMRPLYTWLYKSQLPSYMLAMPYDFPKGRAEVLKMMEEKELDIKLEEGMPLPFTADGARKAFQTVAGGHSHGKVVLTVAKPI